MSKLLARPLPAMAWAGMFALAVAEPALVCTAVLKLVQSSAPGAGVQQLLGTLLYVLPVGLLGPARRGLGQQLPADADRRPMLLVWTAGICSTVIIWHGAALSHGGDRVFQALATMLLSAFATYSYAQLGRRTLLRRVQGRHIAQAVTSSVAFLGLGVGGAVDHQANILGTVLGVALPTAAALWRLLVRDFTTPTPALATAHR